MNRKSAINEVGGNGKFPVIRGNAHVVLTVKNVKKNKPRVIQNY